MRPIFAKCLIAFVLLCGVPLRAYAAATITILNLDGAGEGFNDTTPVAPVGGNPGTTLGQQRLIAFQAAANIYGAALNSVPTIVIASSWDPLTCTAVSAVLGAATPTFAIRDFMGAPLAGHFYAVALANKLAGTDLVPGDAEIRARVNLNLGQTGCLNGISFYLGLDGNHGSNIDIITELLHEFAHGLGFQTFTNAVNGTQLDGFPSIFDTFVFDTTAGTSWPSMTNAQRAASAINTRKVVWTGANVTAAVPMVLQLGTPRLAVSAPPTIAGNYLVGTASLGPPLNSPGLTGEVMPVVDQANGSGLACTPLSALNALAVNGKIALIDRGTCSFPEKLKNAQNAGAIGVIIADNVAGSPPDPIGGSDPTIMIPAVSITLADGQTLKGALATRSRLHSGVMANLGINPSVRLGADPLGRVLLFTPDPASAQSISHWDSSPFPNQLLEPALNGDLTHAISPPTDLTLPALQDLGW